jgi:hypothetical protein
VVHDHHEPGVQQPPGSLHEFQFFGQDDHESVAWLFDDPPPSISDDQSPVESQHHNKRPSIFDPFGQRYLPGNGLTFEVSLGQGEVDARHTETAASATIVSSSGSKESAPPLHDHKPGIEFCLRFVFMCLSTGASFQCLITILSFGVSCFFLSSTHVVLVCVPLVPKLIKPTYIDSRALTLGGED